MAKATVSRLDNIDFIKKIDRGDMLDLLLGFPGQCREGFSPAGNFVMPAGFTKVKTVVFTGLGGSAISGELIRSYLVDRTGIPIIVNRDYGLPSLVDGSTLVIASSYSGNTEETLSAYNLARRRGAKIAVIASGGRLVKRAVRDRIPRVQVPPGFPPRCALGYLFFGALKVLERCGLAGSGQRQVKETVDTLTRLKNEVFRPGIGMRKNTAKRLACRLEGNFPVIYAPEKNLSAVVTRWRSQFAENAKTLSSGHVFPEMNHNEIVGWEFPRRFLKSCVAVFLCDRGDNIRIRKRVEITRSLISTRAKDIIEVCSCGKSVLARIFSLIYLGDFTSFYLAVLNGKDPTPVERIELFKKELLKK